MSKRRGKYLLIGAFLGFLAGLFLAPKKGSELRKQTKEKFDEVTRASVRKNSDAITSLMLRGYVVILKKGTQN